jgi:molybdate transport system permease protein
MPRMLLTPEEWTALGLSLKVAVWSMFICAIPGVLCGWLLSRCQFRGKVLFDALVHLPLVLPPVAVGYLLLLALGRYGPVGRLLDHVWGGRLAFTWQGAVVASTVMAFPLMVRAVRLAVDLVDIRLEQAAATLGASPLRVWLTITLPLAVPGILTGLVLTFARSLGEFGATITFVGNIPGITRTLPLALYAYIEAPGRDAAAARLMMVSILLSFAALLASEWLARRTARRVRGH